MRAPERPPAPRRGRTRIVEVMDERQPLADGALQLIADAFPRRDRQPLSELRSELAEKRLGLLAGMDFHLLAAVAPDGAVLGTSAGLYLEGVNAGFVTYLAVAPRSQGRRMGPALRSALVRRFREDAQKAGHPVLAWVLGEVEAGSPWLTRLLQRRDAITFDLEYFHPGMRPGGELASPFILYRQPVGDLRETLPMEEVRRVIYAIFRRAYRVRYPLEHPGFQEMLRQLEGRDGVGEHPGLPRRAVPTLPEVPGA